MAVLAVYIIHLANDFKNAARVGNSITVRTKGDFQPVDLLSLMENSSLLGNSKTPFGRRPRSPCTVIAFCLYLLVCIPQTDLQDTNFFKL